MAKFYVTVNGNEQVIELAPDGRVRAGGHDVSVDIQPVGMNAYSMLLGTESVRLVATRDGEGYHCVTAGTHLDVQIESERARLLRQFDSVSGATHRPSEIRAPMPALVVKIEVNEGDEVHPGTGLIILEAMKMENEIRSHNHGRVKHIKAVKGQAVEKGELLMLLE